MPATQALQYYHTLKAKGVEARLVYFPHENHWILKPQNSLRWYREVFDWIARRAPGGGRAVVRSLPRGVRPARRAGRRRPGTAATS